MPLLPLRCISVPKPGQSIWTRFSRSPLLVPRRFYYGHISDTKMAPQLEPFFKQYVATLSSISLFLSLTCLYLGWTTPKTHLSTSHPRLRLNITRLDPPAYVLLGLRKAVAIPSISAQDECRKDVVRMAQFLASELEALGAEVHQRPLGKQPGKEHLDLPPVVIARYGNDKNKRTILVYGHYDVQPALKEDGWATEPFELTIDEKDRMYGRGSTDDKGPVLGWLNVIEAHQKAGVEFPVNLLCCFEGMEEYGSEGLDEFIQAEAKGFFKDADAVCISDNYWLGTEKPCLTYGLRGCNYYSISVSGPAQDLHSGVFGGSAHEPMTDLVNVLSKLVDAQGNILIPGIMDLVEPVTEEEKSLYGNISYTMENLHESLGSETSIHPNKERTLMARWRFPSLSIHGIEGAFSAPGAKTVIPAKVIGKFSIRTVPNMESPDVNKLVFDYVKAEFAKLNSKNKLDVWLQHDGKWWVASPKHWNFSAASKAVEQVFGVAPDFTREGGSIPVTLTFEQATGKNVLLLPMGSSTDAAHSVNEKLDKRNYIEGTKLLGAYLHYVAEEPIAS
ncbi:Cys-Gly metallodipeptidase dug1 [Penicillium chermesinum]|nr:Cys-Gly metallodipeptidase dug1 [Penicillium chermesinum]